MVDVPTVRGLAVALPEAVDQSDDRTLAFTLRGKGFAWSYKVRPAPRKPREPRLDVLAVRCDLARKEMLVEAAPDRFFDDDHYRGYPVLLVRLEAVDEAELESLLADAWRHVAPKSLARLRDADPI